MRSEIKMHGESLKQLGSSFQNEVQPIVVDIEGRTLELKGSAEQQYAEWRQLLRELYENETGLPATAAADAHAAPRAGEALRPARSMTSTLAVGQVVAARYELVRPLARRARRASRRGSRATGHRHVRSCCAALARRSRRASAVQQAARGALAHPALLRPRSTVATAMPRTTSTNTCRVARSADCAAGRGRSSCAACCRSSTHWRRCMRRTGSHGDVKTRQRAARRGRPRAPRRLRQRAAHRSRDGPRGRLAVCGESRASRRRGRSRWPTTCTRSACCCTNSSAGIRRFIRTSRRSACATRCRRRLRAGRSRPMPWPRSLRAASRSDPRIVRLRCSEVHAELRAMPRARSAHDRRAGVAACRSAAATADALPVQAQWRRTTDDAALGGAVAPRGLSTRLAGAASRCWRSRRSASRFFVLPDLVGANGRATACRGARTAPGTPQRPRDAADPHRTSSSWPSSSDAPRSVRAPLLERSSQARTDATSRSWGRRRLRAASKARSRGRRRGHGHARIRRRHRCVSTAVGATPGCDSRSNCPMVAAATAAAKRRRVRCRSRGGGARNDSRPRCAWRRRQRCGTHRAGACARARRRAARNGARAQRAEQAGRRGGRDRRLPARAEARPGDDAAHATASRDCRRASTGDCVRGDVAQALVRAGAPGLSDGAGARFDAPGTSGRAAPEVADGLRQIRRATETTGAGARSSSARPRAEREERWSEALALYREALKVDSDVAPSTGRASSARSRARCSTRNCSRSSTSPTGSTARRAARSRATCSSAPRASARTGPRLQEQVARVTELLRQAETPVRVALASDNATDVQIYRIGKLGLFEQPGPRADAGPLHRRRHARRAIATCARNQPAARSRRRRRSSIRCEEPI